MPPRFLSWKFVPQGYLTPPLSWPPGGSWGGRGFTGNNPLDDHSRGVEKHGHVFVIIEIFKYLFYYIE
jgi:hypothetical protein